MALSPAAAAASDTANPAIGEALRILLVEDDAIISVLLAELLSEFGHDICGSVRSEQEAVDAAMRHVPDLMIVDVQLQQGSGVAVMQAILRRCVMPHIFMTAGSRLAIPADAVVLHKPFGLHSLREAMDRVVHKTLGAACRSAMATG
jgi:DNA-binding response OmpR family regulator